MTELLEQAIAKLKNLPANEQDVTELPIYSARISKNYRAVGQLDGDCYLVLAWFTRRV
jgi:hypothetical protein